MPQPSPGAKIDSGGRRKSRKEPSISPSLTPTPASESFATGSFPGPGTYFCVDCGAHLGLYEDDALPECSSCGATSFRRDSIFEPMQEREHGGETTAEFAAPTEAAQPGWLAEERAPLAAGERRLVCRDEHGAIRSFPIRRGWTRIGRSATANVRLDHPSVSRRHALIVSEADESLRLLDDRSLNGVFVNGETIEWGKLEDGDELTIGRYRLFVLEG